MENTKNKRKTKNGWFWSLETEKKKQKQRKQEHFLLSERDHSSQHNYIRISEVNDW